MENKIGWKDLKWYIKVAVITGLFEAAIYIISFAYGLFEGLIPIIS